MKINNWFDFVITTLFMGSLIVVGLPLSVYLIAKGVEGFVKFRFKRLPKNFSIIPGSGNYSFETGFYGIIALALYIWILFVDRGGGLNRYFDGAKKFLLG